MKVKAEHIKLALAKKHTDDLFLTEVKTGKTYDNKELLKFDALAMKKSWANPCLYGYEVKVTRADFLQDHKWPGYMAYCNRFAFVCQKGLIEKEELPEEVGLIWYYPDSGALRSVRPSKHRMIDIPSDIYQYILMSRIESDRHPFYSSKREFFEAWVADKRDSRDLGYKVAEKLRKELDELRRAGEGDKRFRERYLEDSELLEKMQFILREHGIHVSKWSASWEDELRAALAGGSNPKVTQLLKRLINNVDELKQLLESEVSQT